MRVPHREAELRGEFMDAAKIYLPGFVLLRYEDGIRSGDPDLSATGLGLTTWIEFKHGTPEFESPGIQELKCMRLAAAGRCRYVIWQETKDVRRTIVAHPRAVHNRSSWRIVPETFCVGFDHRWLCEWILKSHQR